MAVVVLSGQKSVTTAGTAVALTTAGASLAGSYLIKALPGNTGTVYIGNDGSNDVTSSNGLPLSASNTIVMTVTDLAQVKIDATADAQGVGWLRIAGQMIGVDAPAA